MPRWIIWAVAIVAILGVLAFAVMRRVTPPPAWSYNTVPYTNPSSVVTANTPNGWTTAVNTAASAGSNAFNQFASTATNVGVSAFKDWFTGLLKK
jgi:hypothetical protein